MIARLDKRAIKYSCHAASPLWISALFCFFKGDMWQIALRVRWNFSQKCDSCISAVSCMYCMYMYVCIFSMCPEQNKRIQMSWSARSGQEGVYACRCVCACMHACIHVCVGVCLLAFAIQTVDKFKKNGGLRNFVCVCMYVCIYVYVYIYTYIDPHAHTHTLTYIYTYIYTYTYTCKHACKHTHVHTHTQTQTHANIHITHVNMHM